MFIIEYTASSYIYYKVGVKVTKCGYDKTVDQT